MLTATAPIGVLTHTFNGAGSETDGPIVLSAFDSRRNDLHTDLRPQPQVTVYRRHHRDHGGVPAPEPASIALMGVGLLGLGFVTNRKRSA